MKFTIGILTAAALFCGAAAAQQVPAEAAPPGTTVATPAKATAEDKAQARAARKDEGGIVAKQAKSGEGNPVPAAQTKLTREQKDVARAPRKAETKRANKAGEITSRGEIGLAK